MTNPETEGLIEELRRAVSAHCGWRDAALNSKSRARGGHALYQREADQHQQIIDTLGAAQQALTRLEARERRMGALADAALAYVKALDARHAAWVNAPVEPSPAPEYDAAVIMQEESFDRLIQSAEDYARAAIQEEQ